MRPSRTSCRWAAFHSWSCVSAASNCSRRVDVLADGRGRVRPASAGPVGQRFVLVVVVALPAHVVAQLAPGDQFVQKRFDFGTRAPPAAGTAGRLCRRPGPASSRPAASLRRRPDGPRCARSADRATGRWSPPAPAGCGLTRRSGALRLEKLAQCLARGTRAASRRTRLNRMIDRKRARSRHRREQPRRLCHRPALR